MSQDTLFTPARQLNIPLERVNKKSYIARLRISIPTLSALYTPAASSRFPLTPCKPTQLSVFRERLVASKSLRDTRHEVSRLISALYNAPEPLNCTFSYHTPLEAETSKRENVSISRRIAVCSAVICDHNTLPPSETHYEVSICCFCTSLRRHRC